MIIIIEYIPCHLFLLSLAAWGWTCPFCHMMANVEVWYHSVSYKSLKLSDIWHITLKPFATMYPLFALIHIHNSTKANISIHIFPLSLAPTLTCSSLHSLLLYRNQHGPLFLSNLTHAREQSGIFLFIMLFISVVLSKVNY